MFNSVKLAFAALALLVSINFSPAAAPNYWFQSAAVASQSVSLQLTSATAPLAQNISNARYASGSSASSLQLTALIETARAGFEMRNSALSQEAQEVQFGITGGAGKVAAQNR